MRLGAYSLDLVVISAICVGNFRKTQEPLSVDGTAGAAHGWLTNLFVCVCVLWNLYCFVFLAKFAFPNFWVERAFRRLFGSFLFGVALCQIPGSHYAHSSASCIPLQAHAVLHALYGGEKHHCGVSHGKAWTTLDIVRMCMCRRHMVAHP